MQMAEVFSLSADAQCSPDATIGGSQASKGKTNLDLTSRPQMTSSTKTDTEGFFHMTGQERYTMISIAKQMPLELGSYWFVISYKWFQVWEAAVLGTPNKDFPDITEQTLGPVDNLDIVKPGTKELLPDLVEGYDIELVPEDAWKKYVEWYGQPKIELKREVIGWPTASGLPETRVEVYQPKFTTFLLTTGDGPIQCSSFQISSNAPLSTLASQAASVLQVSPSDTFRVWNLPPKVRKSGIEAHEVERHSLIPISLTSEEPLTDFNRLGRVLAVEVRSANTWILDAESVSISNDPSVPVDVGAKWENLVPGVPFMGRLPQVHVPRGTMGLQNLGNTCFMNSGLQCLLHIPELERYFLQGHHLAELNPHNPLGMEGQMAEAFNILVKQIYPAGAKPGPTTTLDPSNDYSSYVPLHLKGVVCRWAPAFSGYQECDSQELIGTMLDGLHEDLNRILKKPYVEKPEWPEHDRESSRAELEARIAQETWDGHARRNDSIITDLFQGMYKSTLTCPDCGKISVTFDPFLTLSLPLPASVSAWKHTVYFVPWSTQKRRLAVQIELPKDSVTEDLKRALEHKLGVERDRFVVTEVWKHKFFQFFDNRKNITEVAEKDMIIAYELPISVGSTNSDSAPQVVPVLHVSSNSAFALPFIVVLYPESRADYSVLKRLIVERYNQWVSTPDITPESFELYAYGSHGPGPMETGFRLEDSLSDLIDLRARGQDPKKGTLINASEALVAIWEPDQRNRLFPREGPAFNEWQAHGSQTRQSNKQEITLSDCLDELTKVEQLGVNDSWYCSRCKQHRQATKQLQLRSLPTILVLQLKRFAKRSKIDRLVTFPLDGLDLSDRVEDEGCTYDLFAVDEHKSNVMSSGHYTTRAKNQCDGAWYHYQDSLVTPTTPEAAINPGAYLLFYRRRGVSPEDALKKVKRKGITSGSHYAFSPVIWLGVNVAAWSSYVGRVSCKGPRFNPCVRFGCSGGQGKLHVVFKLVEITSSMADRSLQSPRKFSTSLP
ncbi:ubiquitin carboxyl-terminal hydrolase [Rhizoctonia solani AG-1 IA]|uniref:ubiquitinyl hydrolase 1 n=1 Tax=Thanatephorus cucumeris (strain AG1-IA) TaxID=983506 RepID=L8WVU0_THACA|nr:ubiquitin carboxyl-terminal hydrolase [Rhizoctonia solani AG-1 IA]